jgi:GTP-binding protein HflX
MEFIKDLAANPVLVSASSGQGLEELMDRITRRLSPLKEFQIRLPYSDKGLSQLSKLYQAGEMLDVRYEDEVVIKLRGRAKEIAKISMARK